MQSCKMKPFATKYQFNVINKVTIVGFVSEILR